MFPDANVTRERTGWNQMTEQKWGKNVKQKKLGARKRQWSCRYALCMSKEEGKIPREESTEGVATLLGFPEGSLWMRKENVMDLKGRVSFQDRGQDKTEKTSRIKCSLLHSALSLLQEAHEHFVLPPVSSFFTPVAVLLVPMSAFFSSLDYEPLQVKDWFSE